MVSGSQTSDRLTKKKLRNYNAVFFACVCVVRFPSTRFNFDSSWRGSEKSENHQSHDDDANPGGGRNYSWTALDTFRLQHFFHKFFIIIFATAGSAAAVLLKDADVHSFPVRARPSYGTWCGGGACGRCNSLNCSVEPPSVGLGGQRTKKAFANRLWWPLPDDDLWFFASRCFQKPDTMLLLPEPGVFVRKDGIYVRQSC